jgi:dTDP-glucose 4,6-dehydratase
MIKIVVTGGAGFIGSSFVNLIQKYSNINEMFDIIVVDNMTYASNPELLPEGVTVIQKDICDLKKEDIGEVDYIVNFAAESHVDNSIEDGSPFIHTNILGTYNLLQVARQMTHLEKFVQISTDEVYGDLKHHHHSYMSKEDDVQRPSSYYSASKSAADGLVMAANKTYKLPYLITRTCNNYGVNQHNEKFLPKVLNCVENDLPIPLYGDGEHIREWIWVEENVRIIFDLMISDTGIWNIGSGDRYTNKEILKGISEITNKHIRVNHVTDRLGHDRRYGLDSSKLYDTYDNDYKTINLMEYLRIQLT